MNSELLQQVRVLDPVSGMDQVCDVLICDRKIQAIAAQIQDYPEETAIFDSSGLVLAPGLVDLYSYSGEPGHEDRETLNALAAAGAAGGFTRLTILPNTLPVIDNPGGVSLLHQKANAIAPLPDNPITPTPHLQFWGA
ncbi:MAG: dihydroorotase, partial [Halothece sp.]